MNYRDKKVTDATQEELLFELIKRNGISEGPIAINFPVPCQITTIGIGKNNIATIVMAEDDKEALDVIMSV